MRRKYLIASMWGVAIFFLILWIGSQFPKAAGPNFVFDPEIGAAIGGMLATLTALNSKWGVRMAALLFAVFAIVTVFIPLLLQGVPFRGWNLLWEGIVAFLGISPLMASPMTRRA